jgi:hypothetical protein
MSMTERYGITFKRTETAGNSIFFYADNARLEDAATAHHLVCSNKVWTILQIEDLQKAIGGEWGNEEFWGVVEGSSLFIYQDAGVVKLHDDVRLITMADFKQLLEEWLNFISA